MPTVFADIHCHPTMKPYGKSFGSSHPFVHQPSPGDECSSWFRKKATVLKKTANEFAGLTLFTQSDYQSLQKGNVRFICSSLYPVEKGFVMTDSSIGEKLIEFVMGIGLERINNIQTHQSYFSDLMKEYDFLMQMNEQKVVIEGENYVYKTLRNGSEIEKVQELYSNTNVVLNVITIEGAHVLDCGIPGKTAATDIVLSNTDKLRNLEHRPLFITFAHHFYNELCGHARSLHLPFQEKLKINQETGLDSGITDLGLKVIDKMLANHDGKRILVDIKHMNRKSRLDYFKIAAKYQAPVVASHAGVTGFWDENKTETIAGNSRLFVNEDINFYDSELVEIAKSNGLFGIQLDERRIASSDVLYATNFTDPAYHWEKWALLFWRQIQHVGEVLDNHSLPAWDFTCIGSDFDGLINPIGPYWTAAEMLEMQRFLTLHAARYLKDNGRKLKMDENRRISPDKLINKVMGENAIRFVMRNY